MTLDWSDFWGWRAALSARAPKLRAEALAGHNTLRAAVAGYETETLTSAQLEEMKTLLDAELAAGAAGLWQFMSGTGREFGLEVNSNIDERYHVEKETRAACKYLKEAYAKYGNWLCVAAAYNAGQGRISTQLQKQMVSQAADLWLVEETSRYMFRLLAAKAVISNPQRYGFLLKREHLYPAIPYTEVTVTTGIDNLAQFAKNKGITYAQLKDANPWLRDTSLMNKSGRTYILKIPTQAGMHYDPRKTIPYNKNWVIN